MRERRGTETDRQTDRQRKHSSEMMNKRNKEERMRASEKRKI